jgi:hypothetical protein
MICDAPILEFVEPLLVISSRLSGRLLQPQLFSRTIEITL